MQFSQSSAHVECFLIPFLKTTRKNLSKNGFGFCLRFLEVVTKFILKKRFLTIFVSFLAQFFSFILWGGGGLKGPQWGPERPTNEGPKVPPMLCAGARRKGPYNIQLICPNIIWSNNIQSFFKSKYYSYSVFGFFIGTNNIRIFK